MIKTNYFELYDKREMDKVSFDSDGFVYFKDVKLDITRDTIMDYESQTGMDGFELVLWSYNNSLPVLRDKKLEELLS